ncbi:MAG: hypothetical protein ACYC0B_00300 [Gemmatimonadaceae bacterium]
MRASIVPLAGAGRRHVVASALWASLFVFAVPDASVRSSGGVGATARAEARATEGEPVFAAGQDVVLWSDDFDAPKRVRSGIFRRRGAPDALERYATLGAEHMQVEPSAGIDGSGALRIDWQPTGGIRCADDSRLIEASFEPTRELFVQYSVRYSPGFKFDWGARGRCSGNAKKLFLVWSREGSRFVFISENGALGVGSDHDHPLFAQHRAVTMTPAQLADGRWHRITLQIVQSSSAGRADGSVRGWIDGVERWRRTGIVTHNSGGYHLFKMPATFNQGSPVAQREWVDALRLWRRR